MNLIQVRLTCNWAVYFQFTKGPLSLQAALRSLFWSFFLRGGRQLPSVPLSHISGICYLFYYFFVGGGNAGTAVLKRWCHHILRSYRTRNAHRRQNISWTKWINLPSWPQSLTFLAFCGDSPDLFPFSILVFKKRCKFLRKMRFSAQERKMRSPNTVAAARMSAHVQSWFYPGPAHHFPRAASQSQHRSSQCSCRTSKGKAQLTVEQFSVVCVSVCVVCVF